MAVLFWVVFCGLCYVCGCLDRFGLFCVCGREICVYCLPFVIWLKGVWVYVFVWFVCFLGFGGVFYFVGLVLLFVYVFCRG